MGGKLSKRVRHLARCRNTLVRKIATRYQVLDLSLAELVDLQSRLATEEVSNVESETLLGKEPNSGDSLRV
jgi:hypothetical protein